MRQPVRAMPLLLRLLLPLVLLVLLAGSMRCALLWRDQVQQTADSTWDLRDFPLLVARRDHLKWVEHATC
jgi:hypothetical protein